MFVLRKVVLYIAMSLDGYIADKNGSVDWLEGYDSGGNIWICGGADIAGQLMSGGLIDIFHISVIPVILGGGVRLFAASGKEIRLKLLEEKVCNGIAEVVYEKI